MERGEHCSARKRSGSAFLRCRATARLQQRKTRLDLRAPPAFGKREEHAVRAAAFDVEVFDELFDLNPFDLEHGEASRVDRLERQLILKPFIRGRIEGT